ncbi:probable LRR receptor-like serine/threonine-protein kinase At3g47570 [Humulus lupulus]|uniref:probable LRR receptor-like serine/threonine-protein kinase At3g47570 n=1 Tax=Humulus lupulus TaxID=3486 RepID=UPI002B40757C|nr:probable LRR receptor-like serine/threonine-protein kinase At3g47570 [Humulus lupulus]XP_062095202.1 probable LRR receptor-like serine/threonine-protein kinase At3g47570 [Humulus lupulus]XP_062095203.1 probable LRR receptor-like serine/threonine-protein kinase At3g47570 [Humulus lupulus]
MKLKSPITSYVFWLTFSFLHLMVSFEAMTNALGNETDRFALLKFKESVSSDPYAVLRSWNDSIHFCNWNGITCGHKHQRITALELGDCKLRGTVSPYIRNLTFLRIIDLTNNSFFGEIPHRVFHLPRLQYLGLSHNMLEGELFALDLSYCLELRELDLEDTILTGFIPKELGSLTKLFRINLQTNNLTGEIPPTLANISSLEEFNVIDNTLVGTVPKEFGKLEMLKVFAVGSNDLSGMIPPSLYNISSLISFSTTDNQFKGTLPPHVGLQLPNLEEFVMGGNEFSGTIPESFSNASKLEILDVSENHFVGKVPASFGVNLPHLRSLNLEINQLGKNLPNSLDFIASLKNCSQMEMLSLAYNNFGGPLPKSLANLSAQITQLYLGGNQISGIIPPALKNLVNLILLTMENNLLEGVIPTSLGKLRLLQMLLLNGNALSGEIPSSLGNLTQLSELNLSENNFNGSITPNIVDCQRLQKLDLSKNSLSGTIPKEVFGFPSLLELDLSRNSLSGSLPTEVGKLKTITKLNLSENSLTGEIPNTIGGCSRLESVSLRGNFLHGILPSSLASLRGLLYLDLSRNNLTGNISKDLQNLRFLHYLNLSFNGLEGEVPEKGVFRNATAISVVGNTRLCGGVPKLQLPRCRKTIESKQGKRIDLKLIIIIVCVIAFLFLFASLSFLFWRRKSTRRSSPSNSELSSISFLSKVSYQTLYQATNGFSQSMLIGTGSFGSVYKGILGQEGNAVAVKVLNLNQKGASKSFIAECKALRNIRHRNLVKILTCCSSMDFNGNEFKALVFEYMTNGSLDKWLHSVADGENQSRGLKFFQRLTIASDVASAICYLHDHCDHPIIHCDLKPSNVLLDDEMVAHVSDFGLARLIFNTNQMSETQSSTIGMKGTIGYVPPEYAMGSEPSKQGDMYSYGILVLEMFTGRSPTDESFKDDLNLHNFVKMALPERVVQVVDFALLRREVEETIVRRQNYNNNRRTNEIFTGEIIISFDNTNQISSNLCKCLISILEIGLACSKDSPHERMNIGDVIKELQHIKNAYVSLARQEHRQRTRPTN